MEWVELDACFWFEMGSTLEEQVEEPVSHIYRIDAWKSSTYKSTFGTTKVEEVPCGSPKDKFQQRLGLPGFMSVLGVEPSFRCSTRSFLYFGGARFLLCKSVWALGLLGYIVHIYFWN